jgi:biopolymer transport protein ExbD
MAFSHRSDEHDDEPIGEINMIPLIDVMLVLLIVFVITVPVMKHAVEVDLPKASSQASVSKPETVSLSIDAEGRTFWDSERVDEQELGRRMAAAAARDPQPELHIRGDQATRYEHVAKAMAAAQRAGLVKLGFVTEP